METRNHSNGANSEKPNEYEKLKKNNMKTNFFEANNYFIDEKVTFSNLKTVIKYITKKEKILVPLNKS